MLVWLFVCGLVRVDPFLKCVGPVLETEFVPVLEPVFRTGRDIVMSRIVIIRLLAMITGP